MQAKIKELITKLLNGAKIGTYCGIVICRHCDGHGSFPGNAANDEEPICSVCNGTGRIKRVVRVEIEDRPFKGEA